MRALVQRVTEGSVLIEEKNYSASISKGMVILLGVKEGDAEQDMIFVADKCSNLRIFEDENGKMNLSLKDIKFWLFLNLHCTVILAKGTDLILRMLQNRNWPKTYTINLLNE